MTNVIINQENTDVIVAKDVSTLVQVVDGTPQIISVGIQGPAGPKGDVGEVYTFTQSTPSTSWVINHNLGVRTSVTVFNSGSQPVEAEIIHPTINQTVINFLIATSGFARFV